MEHEIQKIKGQHTFGVLFLANFILSFHLFFVIYMNSSFLDSFIGEGFVGIIYMISAFLSILSLLFISRVLRKIGNFKTLFVLTIIEMVLFLCLAYFKSAIIIVPLFIAYGLTFPLMLFNFDIFLENYTKSEENTGTIRGKFLTITNIALILSPFAAGLVLTNGDYYKLYFISAIFLIPFLLLITKFRNFEDPKYHDIKILNTLSCIKENKNLRNIFASQFLLRFFFLGWLFICLYIYINTWDLYGQK